MATFVETAAAKLDELKPGWHEHVDVDTLDLNEYTSCILGQVFGEDRGSDVYDDTFRHRRESSVFMDNRWRPRWREAIKARETELATAGD